MITENTQSPAPVNLASLREACVYSDSGCSFKRVSAMRGAAFDQWLAAHDAHVAQQALLDAAEAIVRDAHFEDPDDDAHAAAYLTDFAASPTPKAD